jgi:hypothetical protein
MRLLIKPCPTKYSDWSIRKLRSKTIYAEDEIKKPELILLAKSSEIFLPS